MLEISGLEKVIAVVVRECYSNEWQVNERRQWIKGTRWRAILESAGPLPKKRRVLKIGLTATDHEHLRSETLFFERLRDASLSLTPGLRSLFCIPLIHRCESRQPGLWILERDFIPASPILIHESGILNRYLEDTALRDELEKFLTDVMSQYKQFSPYSFKDLFVCHNNLSQPNGHVTLFP